MLNYDVFFLIVLKCALFLRLVLLHTGNVNATDRMFIIPCGELGNKITGLQYAILIIFQTFQLLLICTTQFVTDSFYINVTLHLTGQLKVLKTKFKIFASKPDTQINYRKQFISLVNRHCELMELNQNLEDTFNLIILFQFVIVTLLLALLGIIQHIFYIKFESDFLEIYIFFIKIFKYSYIF